MIKTLHLPLKKKWYDMIESGVKTEEYREIKPHWSKRLCHYSRSCIWASVSCADCWMIDSNDENRASVPVQFNLVIFSYGYTRRTMTYRVESITVGYGKPEWGAPEGKKVYIIKLGERLK